MSIDTSKAYTLPSFIRVISSAEKPGILEKYPSQRGIRQVYSIDTGVLLPPGIRLGLSPDRLRLVFFDCDTSGLFCTFDEFSTSGLLIAGYDYASRDKFDVFLESVHNALIEKPAAIHRVIHTDPTKILIQHIAFVYGDKPGEIAEYIRSNMVPDEIAKYSDIDPSESKPHISSLKFTEDVVSFFYNHLMDEEAVALSKGNFKLYEMLRRKKDLKELLKVAPGLFSILAHVGPGSITDPLTGNIKRGMRLPATVKALVKAQASEYQKNEYRWNPYPKNTDTEPGLDNPGIGLNSPGFVVWCRMFPTDPKVIGHLGNQARLVANLASTTHKVSADNIRKLKTPESWILYSLLVANDQCEYAALAIQNPESSVRAIVRRRNYEIRRELEEEVLQGEERQLLEKRLAERVSLSEFAMYSRNYIADLDDASRSIHRPINEEPRDGEYLPKQVLLALRAQLNGARSFEGLLRVSDAYHAHLRQQDREEGLRKAEENYTEFVRPEITNLLVHNYVLQWISNSLDLHIEGVEMEHCVASYARKCADGESIIYSLRNNEGRRVATVEINKEYQIVQIRRRRNASVDREMEVNVQEAVNRALETSRLAKEDAASSLV